MTFASPLRLPLLAALLAVQLSAQAAPAAPVAVSFDTTPRAGQHQRQQIDLHAVMRMQVEAGPEATEEQRAKIAQAGERMKQGGPIKMAMRMQHTMKVDAADAAGWLPMTIAVANQGGSMEVGGNTVPLPANKVGDLSFAARFNPKDFSFELQKFEGGSPEVNEVMAQQGKAMIGEALQLHKALSQRPLKVGESVEVPLTMPLPMPLPGGAGKMDSKVRYTLVRVDKGVAHFDLGMDMQMDVNTPLPKPAAAASAAEPAESADSTATPPPMLHMAITGTGKGSSALRLADRLPLSSTLAMTVKMDMSGPDNGRMRMEMDMEMRSAGQSLAKPATAKKKP